ncbi:hypothetical protein IWX89_000599 [Cryobacterium sp. MP_M3]|uniref:hypothetical protein n=1 Tax=unclassified Cryobacterium TaxID=2649013 RepID=UPI0018CBD1D3|nr:MULTISPECIES: hypothetical protein [unclassified Cryobacterium]MBG6057181.1 hypothetical protein [Cryobacterium sp. MP_M3]
MLEPSSRRWGYLIPRIGLGVVIGLSAGVRLVRSLTDGTPSGSVIVAVTAIAIVAIVIVGVSMRRIANLTLRRMGDELALTHPGRVFLIVKPDTLRFDVASLAPDLPVSRWSRWTSGAVVTVDDEALTLWDRDEAGPVPVVSIPWSQVTEVTVKRVAVRTWRMNALAVRVLSGAMKIDLILPPAAVIGGSLRPAAETTFMEARALFDGYLCALPSSTG